MFENDLLEEMTTLVPEPQNTQEVTVITGDDLGIEYMERILGAVRESEQTDSGIERFVNS